MQATSISDKKNGKVFYKRAVWYNNYIGIKQSCTEVIWIAYPVEQIWGHYADKLA